MATWNDKRFEDCTTYTDMCEVTKEEFYDLIYAQKLDVHPYTRDVYNYPYTSDWKLRNGQLWGVSEGYLWSDGVYRPGSRYWLVK
jgi:hypothetical protein